MQKWTNNIKHDSIVIYVSDEENSANGPGTLPEERKTIGGAFKAFPGSLGKLGITMIFIFLGLGGIGAGFNLLGLHNVSIATLGNIPNLAFTFKTAGLQTAGFLFILAAIAGALITFMLVISRAIGKFFHVHEDYDTHPELKKEFKKKMKSLKIISSAITGVFGMIIILIGAEVIYIFTNVDVININSFIGLFTSNHYFTIGLVFIIGAVTAWFLKFFAGTIEKLSHRYANYLPEKARKFL